MTAGHGRSLAGAALAVLAAAVLAPLASPLDARLDGLLEGVRSCGGLVLAQRASDLVMPVGVAVLGLAVVRALWRGSPSPAEVVSTLAALGAGVLLVGALKGVLERPRPGAEFLVVGGGSFPSGHVANTVLNGLAILTLWSGGVRAWPRRSGWLVLAAVIAIVALARVYGRRHWPSDALGAVAIAGAYGLLAMRHPDPRWRIGVTAGVFALVLLIDVPVRAGWNVEFPAGSVASRTPPLEHVAFGTAYQRGWLQGRWSLDAPDPRRQSAWLRSPSGDVVLPGGMRRIDEVRLVARPRSDRPPDACQHLRVTLNGRELGRPVLQPGWRAYVLPARAAEVRPDRNLLSLRIEGDPPLVQGPDVRQAAFSELSLHAAAP